MLKMKFLVVLMILFVIDDTEEFMGTGVFDINLFRCMLKKEYSCPHEDIDFVMYTPKQRRGKLINPLDPDSLRRAKFKSYEETAFIVHGFNGSHVDRHMRYLRDAYLSRKFNVVMVSWTRLTYYPCYLSALSNTKLVGQCAAQVYAFLTHHGQDNKQITCVGHSLGAHICGMVTTHLTTRQHKIIGLDPAKPLIERQAPRSYRLTRDDADVVQVIHTNSGGLGQVSFSGSLDLCINGGKQQPFCKGHIIRRSRCSHFLSVCYLANAIFKHKIFPAVPCPRGCTKSNRLPVTQITPYGSKLVQMMHIGQDVPEE
ncbi:hypothetical protein HA402_001547 [Bradysia odoriphaga]|nr:hypothetical protein HA402_001547 [Bradysia odoriphaga]